MLLAAGPEAFDRVLTSAIDALEFKWNQVRRRYRDSATGPDRRRAVEEFLGLIGSAADLGVCDPIQRGLILNQVGKLLGLPGEEISRQLRIIARRSPAARDSVAPPRHADVEVAGPAVPAMRELLEVLTNDPGHYASVAAEFDPEVLPSGDLREIARAVADLAREKSGFELAELIGRFESPRTASLILELHAAGERKGNFAATAEGAAARLRELRERCERSDLLASLRQDGTAAAPQGEFRTSDETTVNTAAEQRSKLRAFSEKRGGIGVFAGHRHSAAPPAEPARSSTPSAAD